jgi:hypothetical protein
MTKVEDIEKAIEALPEGEFEKLREWFVEKDRRKWDKEIKCDSDAGGTGFFS